MKTQCQNCDAIRDASELAPYRDFWSRTEIGQEIPAGDCPDCGAFAYIIRESKPEPLIIIRTQGGLVQDVFSTDKTLAAKVEILDCDDCEDLEEAEETEQRLEKVQQRFEAGELKLLY